LVHHHFLITTEVIPVGSVRATMGMIVGEKFSEEILRQARGLGKKLVKAWREKTVLPEAEGIRKSFQERMRNLMLYRKEDWPYEYAFWKKAQGIGIGLPRRGRPRRCPRRVRKSARKPLENSLKLESYCKWERSDFNRLTGCAIPPFILRQRWNTLLKWCSAASA